MNEQNFPFPVQSTHPFPVVRMYSGFVASLKACLEPSHRIDSNNVPAATSAFLTHDVTQIAVAL